MIQEVISVMDQGKKLRHLASTIHVPDLLCRRSAGGGVRAGKVPLCWPDWSPIRRRALS